VLGLQEEILWSEESPYDHRLHGVLLVAQGMSCGQASDLLGDAPRTVAYWVRRFERDGLGSLTEEERPGRPRRLSEDPLLSKTEFVKQYDLCVSVSRKSEVHGRTQLGKIDFSRNRPSKEARP
jgi:transposase